MSDYGKTLQVHLLSHRICQHFFQFCASEYFESQGGILRGQFRCRGSYPIASKARSCWQLLLGVPKFWDCKGWRARAFAIWFSAHMTIQCSHECTGPTHAGSFNTGNQMHLALPFELFPHQSGRSSLIWCWDSDWHGLTAQPDPSRLEMPRDLET